MEPFCLLLHPYSMSFGYVESYIRIGELCNTAPSNSLVLWKRHPNIMCSQLHGHVLVLSALLADGMCRSAEQKMYIN